MSPQVAVSIEHALPNDEASHEDRDEQQISETRQSTSQHAGIVHKKATPTVSPCKLLRFGLLAQIVSQFSAYGRMTQAAERLGLDLPDPLPSHAHLPPDLFQRVGLSIQQTIAKL